MASTTKATQYLKKIISWDKEEMTPEEQERRKKLIIEDIDRFAKEYGWTKRKPLTHCPYCGNKLGEKEK